MELFSFSYQQHHFVVTRQDNQHNQVLNSVEKLTVDGGMVSVIDCQGASSAHRFALPDFGTLELFIDIDPERLQVAYQLRSTSDVLVNDMSDLPAYFAQALNPAIVSLENSAQRSSPALATTEQQIPVEEHPAEKKKGHFFVLASIAFKLLKTVKVFKVALVAASVSVYSVMFTPEFAIALVAILVFHEYGHLRAMKKFGIPTKGMYLIPFVGGLAVGDQPNSRWQDVYISLMGPVFGLLMTVVFYIAYLLTGGHFVGLVASTSALINLFNLLPVYPLDGGRVIKALVFSGRRYIALVLLLFISALCAVGAFEFGFALIGFFIILGVLDIVSGWRVALEDDIKPLNRYGIWFCLLWYLAVLAAFLVIIVLIAESGLPGSEIAVRVLNS